MASSESHWGFLNMKFMHSSILLRESLQAGSLLIFIKFCSWAARIAARAWHQINLFFGKTFSGRERAVPSTSLNFLLVGFMIVSNKLLSSTLKTNLLCRKSYKIQTLPAGWKTSSIPCAHSIPLVESLIREELRPNSTNLCAAECGTMCPAMHSSYKSLSPVTKHVRWL